MINLFAQDLPVDIDRGTLILVLEVLLALVAFSLLFRFLRRKKRPGEPVLPELEIDVASLPDNGPEESKTQLEFYHIPVRVAALVLAPSGREGNLPPDELLHLFVDEILPGLNQIIEAHRPIIRRCGPQLSSQGFAHAFFKNAALPGNRGKGTPWCSLAGKLETPQGQFLVGMVCCAAKPNSLGQIVIQPPGGWLDVLRIKHS